MAKEKTNDDIWQEIKKHEDAIAELKAELKPATLPKQASLADCNRLARKAKVVSTKTDPKKLSEESGVKVKVKP